MDRNQSFVEYNVKHTEKSSCYSYTATGESFTEIPNKCSQRWYSHFRSWNSVPLRYRTTPYTRTFKSHRRSSNFPLQESLTRRSSTSQKLRRANEKFSNKGKSRTEVEKIFLEPLAQKTSSGKSNKSLAIRRWASSACTADWNARRGARFSITQKREILFCGGSSCGTFDAATAASCSRERAKSGLERAFNAEVLEMNLRLELIWILGSVDYSHQE